MVKELKNSNTTYVSFFPTEIGHVALVGRDQKIQSLLFGDLTSEQVEHRLTLALKNDAKRTGKVHSLIESDWFPECRKVIEQYAQGKKIDLSLFSVHIDATTGFQNRVLKLTHKIPFGKTLTYAELAEKAGSPRAARAVGSVMSKNKIPLLIPCHRVVAAGGRLGGFSAPDGIDMKRRLLEMEQVGTMTPAKR